MRNWRSTRLAAGFALSALLWLVPLRLAAQQPENAPAAESGRAGALTLDALEKMALAHNPTLEQARAEIRAAEGRKQQAGLYPNPTIGYIGEQIRGGAQRGGEQGFFLEQDIVLGGKRRLNRAIFEQERQQALAESDEQRLRVTTAVRLDFIRALAAQETVRVREKLAELARQAVDTSRRLFNVGQADRPDLLEAEVEQQQAELALSEARENQRSVWRGLAATVGVPDLPLAPLEGDLESFGALDEQQWLAKMLAESPAVKIAELGVQKAEAVLARAGREPIPDLQIRAGMEQNRELSEFSHRPIGLQGFAEIGVQIPLFNRNQGSVAADRAELDRARREVERVRLLLEERAAPVFENYRIAREAVERYKTQMIPRAQQAYDLYRESYEKMAAAYPQVLIAQRTLFQLEDAYLRALERWGTSATALNSFLLTDGLEAPAPPGQFDRPVREINLPARLPVTANPQ